MHRRCAGAPWGGTRLLGPTLLALFACRPDGPGGPPRHYKDPKAMIAVFEAKYHYNFWRPITAIRNSSATQKEGRL